MWHIFDCQRNSVCCYPGNKHPCHTGMIKEQQTPYGDDVTEPRQRKDEDRNSYYQNSCGYYKCILYMYGTKSYNTRSNEFWTFVDENSITILFISALEMVIFSVNIIIYTVTSNQYQQAYSKLLSSCFCCFNTCRRSTYANGTGRI